MTRFRLSEEKELLEACLTGNKEAWDAFVERHTDLIYKAILRALKKYSFDRNDQAVADLFNSVFVSLLENDRRKLRQFRWKCSLSSWVYLIATRVTVDFLRRQTPEPLPLNGDGTDETPLGHRMPDQTPLPDRQLEMKELERIAAEAKKQLTSSERLFLELFFERGLSASEVARILNTNPNNVYQMKHRLMKKMRVLAAALL